ncbi:MAG: hypothetical protein ACPF9F_01230 [Acholeplasmataceae bacterium]
MFFLCMLMMVSNRYDVVWEHTDVYIEVYDNIDPYTFLPIAQLYVNGEPIQTDNVTYERGVDRTFLSVLTSVEIKTFYIKYRVHFLSYGVTNTITIAFHIVDRTPPSVSLTKAIVLEHHQHMNVKEFIKMTDNYDAIDDLTIIVNDMQVDYEKTGMYPLEIAVYDKSGNIGFLKTTVEILDFLAPTIIQVSDVQINPYETIDWKRYFDINDDLDETMLITIDDTEVDYNHLGYYQAMICAEDLSKNQTCRPFNVLIKDTTKPNIILAVKQPQIDVHTVMTEAVMLTWFIRLEDTYDGENIDVFFRHQINTQVIGIYDVIVEAHDQSNNVETKAFNVEVIDLKAPLVQLNISYFQVKEVLNPLRSYVDITDNYYEENTLDVKIQSNVDTSILGMYEIEVHVSDPSKNERYYLFFIEVLDLTPPSIESTEAMIISNFSMPDYLIRLNITDNYDTLDALHIDVDDDHVDYAIPGIYTIHITLTDRSGNRSYHDIDIIIVDIMPPMIELYETTIIIELGMTSIELEKNIKNVSDNISSVTVDDVTIIEDVDINRIGLYPVIYQLVDDAGSMTEMIAYVKIQDTVAPIVHAEPLRHIYQTSIDMYEGIDVTDESDVDIRIISQGFTPEVGTYFVTYIAYDVAGNDIIFERQIDVVDESFQAMIQPYLSSAIYLFIGVIMAISYKVFSNQRTFDKSKQFKYNIE